MPDTTIDNNREKNKKTITSVKKPVNRKNVSGKIEDQNELKNLTENIVSLYDSGISTVNSLINNVYKILDSSEHENGEMRDKLRDLLAKKLNLRKKDFDNLFDEIFSKPSQINQAVLKNKIDELIKEHSNTVAFLRERIAESRKIRLEEFRKLFDKIQARQKERETEVRNMISEFQEQHRNMVGNLRNFLSEDRAVRVSDLKKLMKKFQEDREERIRENQERANRWKKKTV